jgi:putative transposase
MAADVIVGKKYVWKGMTVRLDRCDGNTAAISPAGSTHVTFCDVGELAPLPRKEETHSLAMQISDRVWKRAVGLADAFQGVLDAASGKRTQDVQKIGKTYRIGGRMAYKLFKKFRANPSPHALLPGKPGRKAGSRVLEVTRERIIDSNIREHYLKPECPTLEALYGRVKIACEKAGIPTPCRNTIRRRVERYDLTTRLKAREGRKKARETATPAPDHLNVTRPLERIEIDHTLVDAILVSATRKRRVMGRPWITFAIDCFTRMIVGFYLSFERPSSKSVALCLAHAFLPKTEWLRTLGIPGTWPTFGFPESIYVDNAMEFRAIALRRGCESYGIKLCYRPPGVPEVGGTIERLIGTMMGRVHLLPGTTQSNVRARGEYDSEGKAQLTLREFTIWLTSEIVTQYHTMTHGGIGKPPLSAWTAAFEGVDRKEPGAPMEVLANFLPADTRVLRRTGVHINRSNYWSDAFAPHIGQKRKVVVHEYPLDRSAVFVRLPNGELTQATVQGAKVAEGSTVLDHLLQAQEDRELEDSPELVRMRHDGRACCDGVLETSADAMKRAKRARERSPDEPKALPALRLYRPANHTTLTVYTND